MAYTTINKGSSYFNTVTYTGNGVNPTSITSVGFKPDWLWIKCRSNAVSNLLFDSVRGPSKRLISNSDAIESTETQISSFDANGWTMDADTANNGSGRTYVAWNWLASNTTTSNTAGSISSTISVNQTAGFSIVSYTGNGTSGATVGHGLGVAPKMIIVKNRTRVDAWPVDARKVSGIFYLNETGSKGSYGSTEPFVSTAPTSTVFSLGSAGNTNFNGSSLIAYCFAEIRGFSKFASYSGNGSTNGTFVYTGFKPAFVIIKRDFAGYDWLMFDNKRQTTFNVIDDFLYADLSDSEITGNANQAIDFVSNGFKCRGTGGSTNGSGGTFIYMAFAENPFVTSGGIPVTAR